jgi:hypothetical protein
MIIRSRDTSDLVSVLARMPHIRHSHALYPTPAQDTERRRHRLQPARLLLGLPWCGCVVRSVQADGKRSCEAWRRRRRRTARRQRRVSRGGSQSPRMSQGVCACGDGRIVSACASVYECSIANADCIYQMYVASGSWKEDWLVTPILRAARSRRRGERSAVDTR